MRQNFYFFNVFNSIFFFQKFLEDIHVLNKYFVEKMIKNISNLPDDFSIDTDNIFKSSLSIKEK